MILSFVAWNMSYWQNRRTHADAWEYLSTEMKPDFALVQESSIPPNNVDFKCILYREIGGTRRWRSGIASRNHPLTELDFDTSYPGSVVAADATLPDGRILTLVRLYGFMDEFGYSITTLHRIFSDLSHYLEGKKGKRIFIIGGDFNASTQFDDQYPTGPIGSHKIFFNRVENFGLTSCTSKFYQGHIQTLRHARSKIPWQNDYIYVSNNLVRGLESCEVIDNEKVRSFSDHNPILVTINF